MVDQRQQNKQSQATPEIERRSLIQGGLAFAGGVLANSVSRGQIASAAPPSQVTNSGGDQIPRRALGITGEQVSIIGLGGYHLGTVESRDLAAPGSRGRGRRSHLFLTTHGSITTTAAKNGWGLDYRVGAIKSS